MTLEVQRGSADTKPPVTGSVVVLDEGAILGSATRLNFRGAGVVAGLSGSYADIEIAGGGGPGGGGMGKIGRAHV